MPLFGTEVEQMKIECPNCGKLQNIPNVYINKKTVKCLKCKSEIPVTPSKSSFPKKSVLTGFAVFFGLLVLIIILAIAIPSNEPEHSATKQKKYNREVEKPIPQGPKEPALSPKPTYSQSQASRQKYEERQKIQAYRNYEKKPKPKPRQRIYSIGDVFGVGYMGYSVWSAELKDKLADGFGGYDYPDAAFLLVKIFAMNEDKKARMIPPFHLVDETGAEYNTSPKCLIDTLDSLVTLNPGVSTSGLIIFDAPREHNYLLKLSGGYWSSENAFVKIPRN